MRLRSGAPDEELAALTTSYLVAKGKGEKKKVMNGSKGRETGKERKNGSGWNSGGRMASAEGGVWGEVSPLQPARGSGDRPELPQRGPGQSPGWKRILAYFKGHRTLLFVPVDALSNVVLEILKHDKI